jgi:hypothetical protein
MHKKRRDYSQIRYNDLPERIEPGERKRINGKVEINQTVFRKTIWYNQKEVQARSGRTEADQIEKKY